MKRVTEHGCEGKLQSGEMSEVYGLRGARRELQATIFPSISSRPWIPEHAGILRPKLLCDPHGTNCAEYIDDKNMNGNPGDEESQPDILGEISNKDGS